MNPPLQYRLLKIYVRLGLTVYFKKWQNVNMHNIPAKGPFLFVANHQNAFLDALLVVCGVKRNPWFLARGDVFKKKWIISLLTFLRIKPVFRFRDGVKAMRKNDQIINECVSLLEQGECILLFVEGNHNEPWTSQNLQRGFAHIAFEYRAKTNNDLQLIPVGYHYEEHDVFRSRVLVNYGEPISLNKTTEGIADSREKFEPLLKLTKEKLRSLILTVPLDEDYPARKNFLIQNRMYKKDMVEQLEADRQLMREWTPGPSQQSKKSSSVYSWFNPLYLYGRLTHLLPHLLMNYVVTKKIRDNQFIGSVKLALSIFLIPLYYVLITALFLLVSSEPLWTLAFLISLPVSGLYAYDQG